VSIALHRVSLLRFQYQSPQRWVLNPILVAEKTTARGVGDKPTILESNLSSDPVHHVGVIDQRETLSRVHVFDMTRYWPFFATSIDPQDETADLPDLTNFGRREMSYIPARQFPLKEEAYLVFLYAIPVLLDKTNLIHQLLVIRIVIQTRGMITHIGMTNERIIVRNQEYMLPGHRSIVSHHSD
jgi:hypothetical protein